MNPTQPKKQPKEQAAEQSNQSSSQAAGLPSGYWQDLTTLDFSRINPEKNIALLPVSAIEQHGAHL
ncbi:MAG: hypothetical protein WA888_06860, partial [Burkholderiaceae bacterium]